MEKSDWLRAVNQFTITKITCEVDMFKFPSPSSVQCSQTFANSQKSAQY